MPTWALTFILYTLRLLQNTLKVFVTLIPLNTSLKASEDRLATDHGLCGFHEDAIPGLHVQDKPFCALCFFDPFVQ